MKQVLSELYGDFLERDLPALTPRLGDFEAVPGKALAMIGMRRSGKTFICYEQIARLLDAGVPKEQILYLNFEDDRLYGFRLEDCRKILDVFYSANPDKKTRRCHFFFDEIQNIPDWERFIRRVLDTENATVHLTGSSAKLLSIEMATAMRGRALDREVFPFSFSEFLRAHGRKAKISNPGAQLRLEINALARDYLRSGGFPEVIKCEANRRQEILQSYVDAVVLRDVVERHGVGNVEALRALVHRVLRSPCAKLSVNRFYHDLKSRGLRVGKDDLYAFLHYLEEAYLLFPTPIWSRSEHKRQVNPKKIYLVDNGIADAWSTRQTPDNGAFLENLVFVALRRRGVVPGYYQTAQGLEVDFAFRTDERTELIQVAWSLEDPETRARELRALRKAAQEVPEPRCRVVTLEEEGKEDDAIEIIPLWKFLLQGVSD